MGFSFNQVNPVTLWDKTRLKTVLGVITITRISSDDISVDICQYLNHFNNKFHLTVNVDIYLN